MAIMIPQIHRECTPSSHEDILFDALKKLPDDYFVIHSFAIVQTSHNTFSEGEIDFVIAHPKKGILCLEAKAGKVYYRDGNWYYASGSTMPHGGPIRQASNNKHKLMEYIRDNGMQSLLNSCKFLHGCWFPSIQQASLHQVALPAECDKRMILCKEALDDPESAIERIFSMELPNGIQTNLDSKMFHQLITNVLCPIFELVPAITTKLELNRFAMNKLLKEQSMLLNYLIYQRSAVINGAAGTGKTMLAIEKARRHSLSGERVLFLCFNKKLCEYIKANHPYENVDYFTIDALACKLCHSSTANPEELRIVLENIYGEDEFPYCHVIIDEGQDFGQERIEDARIIETLERIVMDRENGKGTFYVFYDRRQMIQSRQIPSYIQEADCRLTLYRNCRNTENIAVSSMRLLPDQQKPNLIEGCQKGELPRVHFASTPNAIMSSLSAIISRLQSEGIDDIAILTLKREDTSSISNHCVDGNIMLENRSIPFTTCRKFKGLEADAVVLVDVDNALTHEQEQLLYYVGSSRARYSLDIICSLTKPECAELLEVLGIQSASRNPQRAFASALNAIT